MGSCVEGRGGPDFGESHILSIQSHVVRDYVGNRAAALALQLLGHDVDLINTVDFSSMYIHKGRMLGSKDFEELMNGLNDAQAYPFGNNVVGGETNFPMVNDFHDIPICLSGYTADPEVLASMHREIVKLKARQCKTMNLDRMRALFPFLRGSLIWLMDPVLGDRNRLYVPETVCDQYRKVIADADIVTPNSYELMWLLNESKVCENLEDALAAILRLHALGPSVIFLTSFEESGNAETKISILSVRTTEDKTLFILLRYPSKKCYLGGCGDVLNSLLVDRLMRLLTRDAATHLTPYHLKDVIIESVAILQDLMTAAMANKWCSLKLVKLAHLLQPMIDRPSTQVIQSLILTDWTPGDAIVW